MAFNIKKVEYYYTTVEDRAGEGFKMLSLLASVGVNLLAFTAIPVGPTRTQLTLFPEDALKMVDEMQKSGLILDGPHSALLIQGDDELGALADVHDKLYRSNINFYASSGVTDGRGNYGYILHVRQEDFGKAAAALEE